MIFCPQNRYSSVAFRVFACISDCLLCIRLLLYQYHYTRNEKYLVCRLESSFEVAQTGEMGLFEHAASLLPIACSLKVTLV